MKTRRSSIPVEKLCVAKALHALRLRIQQRKPRQAAAGAVLRSRKQKTAARKYKINQVPRTAYNPPIDPIAAKSPPE